MAWKSLCSEVTIVSRKNQALELYNRLQEEEERIGLELDQLLEQQTQIDVQMTNFKRIIPAIQSLQSDSQELNSAITKTSRLAENISGKVRRLDTAKTNVHAALKRVDDIIDLKNCVDGVQQSMTSGNYEQAAVHIRRYLDLDEAVLSESAVDMTNSGSNTVSNSFSKLKDAEIQLKQIVNSKLSDAVFRKDKTDVERFVRIMPLLNLHEEGIEELTKLLNYEIKEFSQERLRNTINVTTGERSGLVYAEVLMCVYEDIARKYEQYLTMVESAYGPQWVIPFVREIQCECDHQVTEIFAQHSEERSLENKVHTIAIALNSRSTVGAIRPEPRELDTLLTEMSLLSSRTELYFKFLKKKAKVFNIESEMLAVIKSSQTSHKVQELIGNYILIENFFMRESLSKAISVDDIGPNDLVSSLCDDAFFVLQKSLKRGFSTQNTDGVCAMINNASTLLFKEYKEQLEKSITQHSTTAQSGGIDLSDFPSMFQTQTSKTSTPGPSAWKGIGIACNNTETSCQNLKKLLTFLENETRVLLSESEEVGKGKLESCLLELRSTLNTLQELKQEAQTYLMEHLINPELGPLLRLFSSTSHVIDDDMLMDDEFIQRLAAFISQKLAEAKTHLLSDLYEDLVVQLVSDLGRLLEAEIMSSPFNQLGGVRLDKDLRQLISYLSNQTQHPVRDKFSRILQMATVLSLENVEELSEYYNSSSGSAFLHLNTREIKAVLHLR